MDPDQLNVTAEDGQAGSSVPASMFAPPPKGFVYQIVDMVKGRGLYVSLEPKDEVAPRLEKLLGQANQRKQVEGTNETFGNGNPGQISKQAEAVAPGSKGCAGAPTRGVSRAQQSAPLNSMPSQTQRQQNAQDHSSCRNRTGPQRSSPAGLMTTEARREGMMREHTSSPYVRPGASSHQPHGSFSHDSHQEEDDLDAFNGKSSDLRDALRARVMGKPQPMKPQESNSRVVPRIYSGPPWSPSPSPRFMNPTSPSPLHGSPSPSSPVYLNAAPSSPQYLNPSPSSPQYLNHPNGSPSPHPQFHRNSMDTSRGLRNPRQASAPPPRVSAAVQGSTRWRESHAGVHSNSTHQQRALIPSPAVRALSVCLDPIQTNPVQLRAEEEGQDSSGSESESESVSEESYTISQEKKGKRKRGNIIKRKGGAFPRRKAAGGTPQEVDLFHDMMLKQVKAWARLYAPPKICPTMFQFRKEHPEAFKKFKEALKKANPKCYGSEKDVDDILSNKFTSERRTASRRSAGPTEYNGGTPDIRIRSNSPNIK